ncbi:Protein FAM234A [Merluccius polli]|uniref:Protein FAM234A n=1 Tax=Merluccius polli TaxID=89951 RepID=A0AA47MII1_MERPO|nr:Protein FAM234A [Merluccius polli]
MENSTAAHHPTEEEPLKRGEDDKAESGLTSSQVNLKRSCRQGLAFAKLSHWRTAVFFLSLFLCLIIVFAFSFVIPCPVRPQYLATWNRTFSQAATYDFVAFEDANKDKVRDVLFVLKDTEGTQNNTCAGKGLPSPCLFAMAVAGTDGETLWEQPLAPEFHWAQCGLGGEKKYTGWDCLLFHSDQLTALDKYTGDVQWQWPHPTGPKSTLPVLSLPDLDGDGVGEVALVFPGDTQTQIRILSGKTGEQIGSEVTVDSTKSDRHLLHITEKGSRYILFKKDTGLYGLALLKIVTKAKEDMGLGLKKDKLWESKANGTFDLVPVYQSNSVKYVLSTGKPGETSNLLLVDEEMLVLIDGNSLQQLWSSNATKVYWEPSFGHFDKDGTLDIVVEEEVMILNGKSGGVLWHVDMLPSPNSPRPASVNTLNSLSVFMFWGMMPQQGNNSVSMAEGRRSYMLHPLHSKVLLETTNVMDHIFTFKATLLERGRHACYFLLTDNGGSGVMLKKRKLKDDVVTSTVRPMGSSITEEDATEIKEAFNRLRFSDE